MYQNPGVKGNLYVRFHIIFPPNNFLDAEKLHVSMTSEKTVGEGTCQP